MYVQYGFLYLITDQAKITSAKIPDPYTAGVRYNNATTVLLQQDVDWFGLEKAGVLQ
jgi:hypothetical protein